MGLLISRFRKKKTSEEKLEDLSQSIQKIEQFLECEEDKLRIHVRQLVIYSIIIYVFIASIYFILDPTWGQKYMLLVLLLFPLTIFLIRKLLIHYYKWKIVRYKKKIDEHRKEKQKIIENVMETEIYKVAKRILEKYDVPYSSKRFTPFKSSAPSTPIPIPKPTPSSVTPYQSSIVSTDLRRRVPREAFFNQTNQLVSTQKATPTLVRPVIPESKGVFNKILEKFVGDGPNERYALICANCASHNGMALQEEFMYLSYRCVYCGYFNPAKKQRPMVPIVRNLIAIESGTSDSDSSGEKRPTLQITELEDSENETKEDENPIVVGSDVDTDKSRRISFSEQGLLANTIQHDENKENVHKAVVEEATQENVGIENNTKCEKESECEEKQCDAESKKLEEDKKHDVAEEEDTQNVVKEDKTEIPTDTVSPMEVDEDPSVEHANQKMEVS
uniref:Endoplasmic reticulum junction formation protein lunapark n=1 Tax=Cacopsylla melanoneura TaxID=428564 RepID=A0A8D8RCY4_9HEMI